MASSSAADASDFQQWFHVGGQDNAGRLVAIPIGGAIFTVDE